MSEQAPRVFISYSHDSADHKAWVLDFATTLRNRGVDAILDQWDAGPGDDLPHFMESSLREADYVLLICTPRYVDKANQGTGGVGYEKMIVTKELMARIDSNKAIPVIRSKGAEIHVPDFLGTKLYVDMSDDDNFEIEMDVLMRTLLGQPLYEKPTIGEAKLEPIGSRRPNRSLDGVVDVMRAYADAYNEDIYSEEVSVSALIGASHTHRIVMERYLQVAVNGGLINERGIWLSLTQKGQEFLEEHGIIEM